MEKEKFIQKIAFQFDDTDIKEFSGETNFKELEEYSSLTALSIVGVIDEDYEILITVNDLKAVNTIDELFELLKSKAL